MHAFFSHVQHVLLIIQDENIMMKNDRNDHLIILKE